MIRRFIRGHLTALYIICAYLFFFVGPVLLYCLIGAHSAAALQAIHYTVATAYVLTAFMIISEARASWKRKRAPVGHEVIRPRLPMITVIVSAYLPNEQEIIAETILQLSTQMHQPTHKMQIILTYNSPDDLPVEETLGGFSRMNASFMALRVPESTSKAQNIMAALPHVKGEMTVVMDADHHPLPDAFERAYRWLERGYDIVQGRCVVRKQKESWLARYISVEFEQIYAVSHAGRSLRFDVAIFGGSNGYWRTSVLREIGMNHNMLTEDIDATVRAVLAGYRVIHDRSVVSSELAPPSVSAWWKQRLRWAQGWLQVTLIHQRSLWHCEHLSFRQKLYWTYLLGWREFYAILSLQVFALLAAAVLLRFRIGWFNDVYLLSTSVITLTSGPLAAYAAYRVALWRTQERLRNWFVIYGATAIIYSTVKNTVALVAMVRQLLHQDQEWVVTPRSRAAEAIPLVGATVASTEAVFAHAIHELTAEWADIGLDSDILSLPLAAATMPMEDMRGSAVDRGTEQLGDPIKAEFGMLRAADLLFEPVPRLSADNVRARLELNLALKGIWAVRRQRDRTEAAGPGHDHVGWLLPQAELVGPTTFDMEVLAWILGLWQPDLSPGVEFTIRQCARDFGAAWSGRWAAALLHSLDVLSSTTLGGDLLVHGTLLTNSLPEPLLAVTRPHTDGPPQAQRVLVVPSRFFGNQLRDGAYVELDWHVLRRRLQTPLARRLYVFLLAERERLGGVDNFEVELGEPLYVSLGTVDRGNVRRLRAAIAEAALGIQLAEPRIASLEMSPSPSGHTLSVRMAATVRA